MGPRELCVGLCIITSSALVGCLAWADGAPAPLLKPLFISGHRGGGRVHAPDNTWENLRYGASLGVSALEVDLQLTGDDHLILFHDASIPRSWVEPGYQGEEKVSWRELTVAQIAEIRYSATVGEREFTDIAIPDAHDVVTELRDQVNFHLDVKGTPAERIIRFIADHDLAERCVVMNSDLDYLREVRTAFPEIPVEYPQNLLGRFLNEETGKWEFYPEDRQRELYCELLEELSALGRVILCTKGLQPWKVELCHRYGVAVRPSAGNVKLTDGAQFLRMGVDGILGDNPEAVLEAVAKILGPEYLPVPAQPIAEVFLRLPLRP